MASTSAVLLGLVDDLLAEIERLNGLIKQVQWSANDGGDPACPWCGAWAFDKQHHPECAALGSETGKSDVRPV